MLFNVKPMFSEPKIPINPMLKSRAGGTYGCYETLAVTIDCSDPCGPLTELGFHDHACIENNSKFMPH